MAASLTSAGLAHIAARAAAGEPLTIDQMVFAYLDGLDPDATPPPSESMPDAADIVHQADLTSVGKVGTDTVVYSKLLGTDIGPFTFNWVGLYDSAADVLVGVSYVTAQTKTQSAGSSTGNSLTKNFAVQYTNIASIANVTIDAETWQLDITAELSGMQAAIAAVELDMATLMAALPAALAATQAVGSIIWWPGTVPPANFLECAGQAVSRATYAELFAVIGITFGAGDGASTFNLPDLRGEFIRGWDHGRGIDAGRQLGSHQLDALQRLTGTFTTLGRHDLPPTGVLQVDQSLPGSTLGQGAAVLPTVITGLDSALVARSAAETRPRSVALMACIRYAGGPTEIEWPDVTAPQLTGAEIADLYEAEPDRNAFTAAEKAKLAALTAGFLGYYADEAALLAAHPSGAAGQYALLGTTDTHWIWDTDSAAWVDSGSTSTGDMLKAVYDPNNRLADAFSMGSMVETPDAKVLTAAERGKLDLYTVDASGNMVLVGSLLLAAGKDVVAGDGRGVRQANDTGVTKVGGGSAFSVSNGAVALLFGNGHATEPGVYRIMCGNVAGAYIELSHKGNSLARSGDLGFGIGLGTGAPASMLDVGGATTLRRMATTPAAPAAGRLLLALDADNVPRLWVTSIDGLTTTQVDLAAMSQAAATAGLSTIPSLLSPSVLRAAILAFTNLSDTVHSAAVKASIHNNDEFLLLDFEDAGDQYKIKRVLGSTLKALIAAEVAAAGSGAPGALYAFPAGTLRPDSTAPYDTDLHATRQVEVEVYDDGLTSKGHGSFTVPPDVKVGGTVKVTVIGNALTPAAGVVVQHRLACSHAAGAPAYVNHDSGDKAINDSATPRDVHSWTFTKPVEWSPYTRIVFYYQRVAPAAGTDLVGHFLREDLLIEIERA